MSKQATLARLLLLLLVLLAINIVTVVIASDGSSVTVTNRTEHYLHVFIDNQPFLYVAPNHSVTYATETTYSMLVRAVYAPGQGISGSVVDTVAIPYRPGQQGCTCDENELFGECTYTPPSGGDTYFEIQPADLVPD